MSTSFTATGAALRRRDALVTRMSENLRVVTALASVAMLLAACIGPSGTAVATPSRSAAPPPGLILFEHLGNAADGTQLADTEQRHLWLVKADGSNLHELAPGQPSTGKGPAAWSPDRRHIAFQGQSQFADLLFETDVDGTTLRLISTECAVIPVPCDEGAPAYSPDGKRLAFTRETHGTNGRSGVIGIRDLATNNVTLLESTRQGPPRNELGAPTWSPDGTKLVYYQVAKDADGKPTGSSVMYIVNTDGTGLHALKTPGLASGDPHWSPDGSLIVFSTEPIHEWNDVGVPDHPDVYTIHPDGTGLKQLTFDQGSGAPSWTPDGKILYFSQRGLWLMDADGSDQTQVPLGMDLVSQTTGYSYYADWQPMP
jgi:Tol biopolymer transport system component